MAARPLVSICVFNYNYGRFLSDAVSAALAETYANIEVVVCDAGDRNEFRELLRMDHIRWPVMLTQRRTLLRFADFDKSLHAQADWDALLAMGATGIRFGYIPQTQALIRRHAGQCSFEIIVVQCGGESLAPMVPAAALVHRFSCLEQVGCFAENLPVLDDWHCILMLALHVPITASGAPTTEIDSSGTFFGSAYARAGAGAGADAFLAIVDMLYAAVPVPSATEQELRAAYRSRLARAWPAPGSGSDVVDIFITALADADADAKPMAFY